MIVSTTRNILDSQKLLEAYTLTVGREGDEYWEPLSDSVRELVHRSVGKREVGDLEDFEEDCVVAIWSKINALKTDPATSGIENLEAFVRQAVHNRYCDAIRRKRPKWYNLKLEALEIFSGKANIEGFALWQAPESSGRMCGFAGWKGSSRTASAKCRELIDDASAFRRKFLGNRDPLELPTHELAAAVLDFCGAPVEIDTLTSCMAQLRQVHNAEPLSIDSQPDDDSESGSPVDWLISSDANVEREVVDASWFNHVIDWFWKEFLELSLKQKKALLYGMSADQVMALAASVRMKEVAESLEMTRDELAALMARLPLPDQVTAEELGVQPRAVPSVRFKAWGRIRRRTRKSSLSMDGDN